MNQDVYNYNRFDAKSYDFLNFNGPRPGEKFPEIKGESIDGKEMNLSDFKGKWFVLETGSFTCPMYIGIIPKMTALSKIFNDVEFLVLYVREVHPGTIITAHTNMDEKRILAKRLLAEEAENRTLIIDDINGTAHKSLGSLPNIVYIVNPKGIVVHRSCWADPKAVEAILKLRDPNYIDPLELREPPQKPIKTILRVCPRAGKHSFWDLMKGMPRLINNYKRIRKLQKQST